MLATSNAGRHSGSAEAVPAGMARLATVSNVMPAETGSSREACEISAVEVKGRESALSTCVMCSTEPRAHPTKSPLAEPT